jgi:competence protein ComEC
MTGTPSHPATAAADPALGSYGRPSHPAGGAWPGRAGGAEAAGEALAVRVVRRDPDPDGVALAVAVALGVSAGGAVAWLDRTPAGPVLLGGVTGLVVVLLAGGRRLGRRWPLLAGVLALTALAGAGGAVAGLRAAGLRAALLPRLAGRAAVVVDATVAEEPDASRFGARQVVLSVRRVDAGGTAWRTRERATVFLPDAAGRLGVGDRLRLRAMPARVRRASRLGRAPPAVLRRPVVLALARAARGPLRASDTIRADLRRQAAAILPAERAGLLSGMALGDTSGMPADLQAAFRAAGLGHLVAVSGSNLAVVLGAGLGLAALLGAARPVLACLGVLMAAGFVVLTRWEPSVLRAGVMAGLVLAGVASGRGPGGRRALCLAVALLLLADPGLAEALGFRLSVAATAGVLWAGPLAASALPRSLPARVRLAVGVTLGAQAGAVPVVALSLGEGSLAGLPANVLALPLATGPMLLGVLAAVAAPVAPPVAALACHLADPFLVALIAVARWAGALPGAAIPLSGPVRAAPALAVAAAVVLACRRARILDARQQIDASGR